MILLICLIAVSALTEISAKSGDDVAVELLAAFGKNMTEEGSRPGRRPR